jgi:hypothetical protein
VASTLARFEPSGFLPWGHLKTLVYVAPVNNIERLDHYNYPGIFERMRQSMMRRADVYIESHGGYFDHLLQRHSLSCNSQNKCFPAHVDIDIFSCF